MTVSHWPRIFRYDTRKGPVYLWPQESGRYAIVYDEENLGSYHSAEAAADDAAGGHTFSPPNGVDLATLGLPKSPLELEWRLAKKEELLP
jgi:hypothetical protein